ncbi:MAG TPA: hypothetical protein DIT07_13095 [Sphingobacteriaceae bacterium]|nr:hypothetical protein [Sphingobacteriaceae bacterium]
MKKLLILFFAGISLFTVAIAQKLPSIQENSLRAPSGIKIDGKATEWNNQFQAYNKNTEIYYTISNDSKNLYLAIQATDRDIANKIICSGLTFMINGSGKMKDQDGMSITFPALKRDRRGGVGTTTDRLSSKPPIEYYKDAAIMNVQLNSLLKDIKVAGTTKIPDTISIYNPEGIKAAAMFDDEKIFTVEMAIPRKYLQLTNNGKSLVYSIKIDGALLRNLTRRGVTSMKEINGVMIMEGPDVPRIQVLMAPTDFSGEYTLAK